MVLRPGELRECLAALPTPTMFCDLSSAVVAAPAPAGPLARATAGAGVVVGVRSQEERGRRRETALLVREAAAVRAVPSQTRRERVLGVEKARGRRRLRFAAGAPPQLRWMRRSHGAVSRPWTRG